jgi:SAM-dependent methyltransferase
MTAAVQKSQFDDLLEAVAGLGIFRAPRRVQADALHGVAALEGETEIQGREVSMRLILPAGFPLILPKFFLHPWDALGVIPHVTASGFICFADDEGLVLDRRNALAVVHAAFDRVQTVLSKGVSGENRGDFVEEFSSYWDRLPSSKSVFSVIYPDDVTREVLVVHRAKQDPIVADSLSDVIAYFNGDKAKVGKHTIQNALYLPLQAGSMLEPPRPDRPFWSAIEARRVFLPLVSAANALRLQRLLRGRRGQSDYVIVGLPRRAGGVTLFGIRFGGVAKAHPLAEGGTAQSSVPLGVNRLDPGYVVARGGGNAELRGRRALIIGCGAIGGHLVAELARLGILNLVLVDPDPLSIENAFRHALGRKHIGRPKVEGLKAEIEAMLPYVRVTPIAETIEHTLVEDTVDLTTFDLVVSATGKPTVDLEVNARLKVVPGGPPAIFTWLEPLGLGGHALLTGNADKRGCFECLFTPSDGDAERELDNRASFAAPGQVFGRALTGCGSLHTPYGSADAVQTAVLTARLAADVLTGREGGNPLRSWKGDSSDFTRAGFHVSPRFEKAQGDLDAERYDYPTANCRACGETGREAV